MDVVLRAARKGDLTSVYDVLGAAFDDAPIDLFVRQTEGDSTLRWRHVRVAVRDGRVLAHVRIFARRMMVRGVAVRAGGIGSVASAPEARGMGLPSALLRDAHEQMRRDGMAVAYLYTGIPAFYERLGWRIVREPELTVEAADAASIAAPGEYRVRRMRDHDAPALLRIYRGAIASSTGAVVRTAPTWRDARGWLGEDAAGCLVAESDGRVVAYARSRQREFGYQVLEVECASGHDAAVDALLQRIGRRAAALAMPVRAYAPADSALAASMRRLPRARETTDVEHPMMMRIIDLAGLVDAVLPSLSARAGEFRGPVLSIGLRDADGTRVAIEVAARSVRRVPGPAQYELDAAETFDVLLGQRHSSEALPGAPREVRDRIDAVLPAVALHFWNSDRI